MIILFSNIHGHCLILNHHDKNSNINQCELHQFNYQGYSQCLRCYINAPKISLENITLKLKCSPILDLHCIDLYFNDTQSYEKFSLENINLINKLFDKHQYTRSEKQNSLNIHIKYDILYELSFDTFRSFDDVKNRSYHGLQFELNNHHNQLTLKINHDIQKMTLYGLQITIYCGFKGLYQYYYVPGSARISPVESLTCEIPTTTSPITSSIFTEITNLTFSTIRLSTASTKHVRYKLVTFFSLVGSGSFIFCCILTGCLYILCKQSNRKYDINIERRTSIASSITDSISSGRSFN
ncbi:unnamed protein product [Rotaria sp. Silwood2]|nr:unnamed protein product [Rotaria sp. Silwood2]CAF3354466.1 unnamed protein product [Rotaria sp. Silwood2]CAF3426456.1 unnamed protein product [Rotaria sp. Silwood2]CAF4471787.1 unnamed protein product [Rotaria sp. Silwood2]CAF4513738.1 unnamed protein product [Rotaria sp. Silwood2]